ncbi:MAG TPA: TetR/AcrR family transcriptional regulator [Syntrophorhabdaceae bacterium]|nr:TetR/AcrR family transcriptional regulator [Syntrophorhabdaceae bacterium]
MKIASDDTTRDRIIHESIQLFLRTSYKGTTIQQITDALGITKGAFYWHFKSKNELLETIIDKYETEFLKQLYTHMKSFKGNFIERFKEYHKYINEYARDNGDFSFLFFVSLAAETTGSSTPAETKMKNVLRRYHKFVASLLQDGKDEHFFRDSYDVTLNAHLIIAIHSGVLLQWYLNRASIDGPNMARTYRDIMLYGMVARDKHQQLSQ